MKTRNPLRRPQLAALPQMPGIKSSLPGPDDTLRACCLTASPCWRARTGRALGGRRGLPGRRQPRRAGEHTRPGLVRRVHAIRGTKHRTFAEINETVESVGASIGFSSDRHITNFSTKSLAEDLDLVLGMLADELRAPVFPAPYIDQVRGLRYTALAERENDTRQMAGRTFRELMYGDHPLGRDMLGTRESVAAIQRDSLVEFYEKFYRPQDMVVVVVGAVPAQEAVRKIEAAFGDWHGGRPPRTPLASLAPLNAVRKRHVVMPDKTQSDIILGWHGMRRLDPDFDPARVANTVLGVFGMMGRLGTNVREKQGMAYYAYSRLSGDREPGTWVAVAGVNPANVERAQQAMLDEVKRLQDELVPEDELEDSKRYLTGSVPLQLETNDGVASLLVDIEWHGLGLDYLERYPHIINSQTAEAVQQVARKYFKSDGYVVALAGPNGG